MEPNAREKSAVLSYETPIQLTDPRALRAVAHPTRLELLALLRRVGPLTATEAGERIGESPAGCSYHLRQLAKWDLVEEAGGGRGRARPWRATAMGHEWAARGPRGEPDEASDLLTRVVVERWFDESLKWVERRRTETEEWSEAAVFDDRMLHLTPAELEDLNRRVGKMLEPYARRVTDHAARPADSRAVTFIQLGFPIDDEGPAA
jgi:DNA-binding transcriptional ArsR family regulator